MGAPTKLQSCKYHCVVIFQRRTFVTCFLSLSLIATYPLTTFAVKKGHGCYFLPGRQGWVPGWETGHIYRSTGLDVCNRDKQNRTARNTIQFDHADSSRRSFLDSGFTTQLSSIANSRRKLPFTSMVKKVKLPRYLLRYRQHRQQQSTRFWHYVRLENQGDPRLVSNLQQESGRVRSCCHLPEPPRVRSTEKM